MAAYPNGTQRLIKWNSDDNAACARIICCHFGGSSDRCVVLLPDGDLTDEDYNSDAIAWIRVRPPGGGLPFGIQIGDIEDMNLIPSDEEMQPPLLKPQQTFGRSNSATHSSLVVNLSLVILF